MKKKDQAPKKKNKLFDIPDLPEEDQSKGKWQKGDMRRLYRFATPYGWQFFGVFLMIVITTLLRLIQPRLIQMIMDNDIPFIADAAASSAVKDGAMASATHTALFYLATVVVSFLGIYFQIFLLQNTGQKILITIRQTLYDHILSLPTKFFDHYPLGSLVTRVTNDTETLNEMFTSVLSSILRSIFSLVGIVAMMFLMDARLAAFVMLLLPFIVVLSVVFRNVIRKVYRAQRRMLSMINSKLAENIAGMRTISVFHRQAQIKSEFDEVNSEYLELSSKEVTYYAIYRPLIEIIRSLGIAALIWFGGRAHLDGLITFGVLYAFIDYIQRFFQPIMELAEVYNLIQSSMTSTGRIFRLLDEEREVDEGQKEVPESGLEGHIEFKNVWFAYNEGEWVLRDVSFEVAAGEFVAFVGATGAGKSTIMHLLCRFYDIDKGQILIDGTDIRDYKLKSLRKAIGVVQQNVFLYSGTILQNITLGREEVDRERAYRAAQLVNADKFIQDLPERYDEPVTERGSTLSAGQRQLLSFARTIASDPSLLILDEATANIDTETELLIQEAIREMAKERSMIAVAHRISTIADADKIIVMHHGRVAEQGDREELLAQDGLFRVLYELQYKERPA